MKTFCRNTLTILLSLSLFSTVQSQDLYEFGDAPESVIAYPSSGVIGWFPTCITVGQNWVQHNNFGAQLGPTFDFEPDGNGGLCPSFAPYDNDECFQDGDAGLLIPEAYTIVSNAVVPCPGFNGTPLGMTCALANWGIDVDIDVANFMPNMTIGYLNVVMDFTQNGVWGDHDTCAGVPVPEHVLVNFPVPNGFAGPISALGPPPFTIGNHSGYVWTRFMISEAQVAPNWDGHGFFEDGESEDYLLEIMLASQSDFGDAPEDVLAYPSNGVIGAFPTCIGVGANSWVEHIYQGASLGPAIDLEVDGNAGQCPGFAPYDDDECYNDGDAGLLIVESFTIVGGVVTACPGVSGQSLGYPCDTAVWGTDIDIHADNQSPYQMDMYLNVLVDWNKDGDWGDTVYCNNVMVEEHVLQNFIIPFGFSGPISGLLPPDFIIGPENGYFWSRFTLGDMPVNVPWDGAGVFEDGETEDYLIKVDTASGTGDYDYGDAPDGVVAYPVSGVFGNFPTCMNVPATSYIQHSNFGAVLGPMVDFENEGNAGLCPLFAPYDFDECFNDGDAGLIIPDAFTIQGMSVVPCPGAAGTGLGTVCNTAVWGTDIDISVTNNMPNQTTGYMNVVIDWARDGDWGDVLNCPGATAPEHVLQNFPIPNGYSGPLSGLSPPNFVIGPNSSHVWARFTISETMVAPNWDGSGVFEDGESEDYLLLVYPQTSDAEYGDAPEGPIAYPSLLVAGNFPTCISSGPPNHYVEHQVEELIYFGMSKDFEMDGNAGLCSPYALPYNNDECFSDGDAGLIIPDPYTIIRTGGFDVVVPCTSVGRMLDTICGNVQWGPELDIHVVNMDTIEAVVNVLMDFSQNGRWALDTALDCSGVTPPEHVLVNFGVPPGFSGPLSALNPPPFLAGPYAGYVWARFTISERNVVNDWNGVDFFEKGETEDYLLRLDLFESIGETGADKMDIKIYPNPSNNGCHISYRLISPARVKIEIFDSYGRIVSTIPDTYQTAGSHEATWDGSTTSGYPVSPGVYLIKITVDEMSVLRKLLVQGK